MAKQQKNFSKAQISLALVLVIVSLVCLVIDGWYYYILKEAPEKYISTTYLVGEQTVTKADGTTETKSFCELNIYDNCFEIVFNYMRDENQDAFYSQGIQLVSKDNSLLNFETKSTNTLSMDVVSQKGNFVRGIDSKWTYLFGTQTYINLDTYEYASGDGFETTINDSNSIDLESTFKIQIGDELYLMKFKGDKNYFNYNYTSAGLIKEVKNDINSDYICGLYKNTVTLKYGKVFNNYLFKLVDEQTITGYRLCDVWYFIELLANSVKSLTPGTSHDIVFQFGDLFDYYKYDKDTEQYSEDAVSTDLSAKIIADIKSYYSIKVTIHEGNMISSSQSIMNCYRGSMNYNVDTTFNDYFIGRSVIDVDIKDFELVKTETVGLYKIKLSDSFNKTYYDIRDKIVLNIFIEDDYFTNANIKYAGLDDSIYKNYIIYDISTG